MYVIYMYIFVLFMCCVVFLLVYCLAVQRKATYLFIQGTQHTSRVIFDCCWQLFVVLEQRDAATEWESPAVNLHPRSE